MHKDKFLGKSLFASSEGIESIPVFIDQETSVDSYAKNAEMQMGQVVCWEYEPLDPTAKTGMVIKYVPSQTTKHCQLSKTTDVSNLVVTDPVTEAQFVLNEDYTFEASTGKIWLIKDSESPIWSRTTINASYSYTEEGQQGTEDEDLTVVSGSTDPVGTPIGILAYDVAGLRPRSCAAVVKGSVYRDMVIDLDTNAETTLKDIRFV